MQSYEIIINYPLGFAAFFQKRIEIIIYFVSLHKNTTISL